ncbi:hypothetical protein NKH18_33350 [Streptomyces sp. M10(2022)]
MPRAAAANPSAMAEHVGEGGAGGCRWTQNSRLPGCPAVRAAGGRGARVLVSEVAYGPDGFEGQVRYVDDPDVGGELARHSDEPLAGTPDPEDVAYVTQVPEAAARRGGYPSRPGSPCGLGGRGVDRGDIRDLSGLWGQRCRAPRRGMPFSG